MKFSSLQNYKHDVIGKLSHIDKLVSPITEADFRSKTKDEIFLAVHESIIKILKTSKETLLQRSDWQIKLTISERSPSPDLPILKLGKCVVRAEVSEGAPSYFYFTQENTHDLAFAVGSIESLLPINEIVSDFLDEDSLSELRRLVIK